MQGSCSLDMVFTSFDVRISLDKCKHLFLIWLLKLTQYLVLVHESYAGRLERSVYGSVCSWIEYWVSKSECNIISKYFFLIGFIWEREGGCSHLLVYIPNSYKDWSCAGLKLTAENLFLISILCEWQVPNSPDIPCCHRGSAPTGSWSQREELGIESWNSNVEPLCLNC